MTRILGVLCGMFCAATASAQVAESEALRDSMTALAAELLETVARGPGPIEQMAGFDRRASLSLGFDDPERRNWQYWPAQRVGLEVGLMTAEQRKLTHGLLNAVLSSNGYLKATHIMQLERILGATDEAGFPRSVGHYKLVFFGSPSTSADWAWRFEGHHVSLSVTVGADGITVTPSFFGSNSAEVRTGPLAGLRVHGAVEDMAREQVDARELSFAWMGSTARGEPHYFRLQGADFVYEYDNVQNDGNHVHSAWRSKAHDFGRGALAPHYGATPH